MTNHNYIFITKIISQKAHFNKKFNSIIPPTIRDALPYVQNIANYIKKDINAYAIIYNNVRFKNMSPSDDSIKDDVLVSFVLRVQDTDKNPSEQQILTAVNMFKFSGGIVWPTKKTSCFMLPKEGVTKKILKKMSPGCSLLELNMDIEHPEQMDSLLYEQNGKVFSKYRGWLTPIIKNTKINNENPYGFGLLVPIKRIKDIDDILWKV